MQKVMLNSATLLIILLLHAAGQTQAATDFDQCANISKLTLVNARTNATIGDLPSELDLGDYSEDTAFNIRVDVNDQSCSGSVKSVLIKYSSSSESTREVCDSNIPYSVFGEYMSSGRKRYNRHVFPNIDDTATIEATPYFSSDCTGTPGRTRNQSLTIQPYGTAEPSASPTFYPTQVPTENICSPEECIGPAGGIISIPNVALLRFDPGMFDDNTFYTITTTQSTFFNSIYTATAAIFRPKARLPYELVVTVDQEPQLADIAVGMSVPRTFLTSVALEDGFHIVPLAVMDVDYASGNIFNLIDGSVYDPVTRRIRFQLPASAFRRVNSKRTYEAVVTLAATPGDGTSASGRRLATTKSGLCKGPNVRCPVQGGCNVSSPFEYQRVYPAHSSASPSVQLGTKYITKTGTPILAAAGGKVERSFYDVNRFGNTTIVRHNDLSATLYGFLRRRDVQEGALVSVGQQIGLAGANFMHFALVPNGALYDAEGFIDPDPCLGRASQGSITVSNSKNRVEDAFTVTLDGIKLGTTTRGVINTLSVNNLIPGTYALTVRVARAPDDSGTWYIQLKDGLKFKDGTTRKEGDGLEGETFKFTVIVPENAGVRETSPNYWTQALIECSYDPVCAWGKKDGGPSASQATAESNNKLVTASLLTKFCNAAAAYDVPVALIMALASRESNMGTTLGRAAGCSRSGYASKSDGECNAFGILQVDGNKYSIRGTFNSTSQDHIYQAVNNFRNLRNDIVDTDPTDAWAAKYQLKAAVVAYDASLDDVESIANMDSVTEDDDYGSDVMTQAMWFYINGDKCQSN